MRQPNDGRKRVCCRSVALVAATLAFAGPLAAQEPPETAQKASGREHVVRRGDTLWDLARHYLNNPFLWGLIYEANRETVEDPHWIYPAERIVIPGLPPAGPDAVAVGATPAAPEPQRTRFYTARKAAPSPDDAPANVNRLGGPVAPPVPQVEPGEFYTAPWLSDVDGLERLGRVVSVVGKNAARNDFSPTVHPYDEVYLEYAGAARPDVGQRLLLVRTGRRIDRWGRMIEPVAIATVSALHDEVMTATVVEQFGVLEEGALAVPLERYPGPVDAAARPIDDGPEGELIAFEQTQPLPAPADRGFVDLGREDGLEVGDELIAFLPPRRAPDANVMLPPETVARLRVVRVAERSSTVQVVHLEQPSLRPGLPVRVVAKRP